MGLLLEKVTKMNCLVTFGKIAKLQYKSHNKQLFVMAFL